VKFRAAGMESCLTKPITRDQLLAALASVEPGKAVL
jgi:BarA-like signal transduction histidine kinase